MSQKRLWLLALGIVIGGFLIIAYQYYRQYLGSIWPALNTPKQDIVRLIEQDNLPLSLPANFNMTIFAEGFDKPRDILIDPNETVIVSLMGDGQVVALPDDNNDGQTDELIVLAENLNRPHGLAIHCLDESDTCELYVAASDMLHRYSYHPETRQTTNHEQLLELPDEGRHYTKSLLFHPSRENILLISIGSSCDVCYEEDTQRGSIQQLDLNADELTFQPFALGLRNAVFLTEHPITQDVWVTEMGRDFLGDDLPPDEVNIISLRNDDTIPDFGWPMCYGKNVHDRQFDKDLYSISPDQVCARHNKIPAHIDIPAHSAPLGLTFIPPLDAIPQEFHYNLLVAYHGSWNRSVPTGYKIVRYALGTEIEIEDTVSDFITGWLRTNQDAYGRPVDLTFNNAGDLFISDDKAGVIYRVTVAQATAPTNNPPETNCFRTGCSGQVCADQEVITTCEYKEEYSCYQNAVCERQPSGECGWTITEALNTCLERSR